MRRLIAGAVIALGIITPAVALAQKSPHHKKHRRHLAAADSRRQRIRKHGGQVLVACHKLANNGKKEYRLHCPATERGKTRRAGAMRPQGPAGQVPQGTATGKEGPTGKEGSAGTPGKESAQGPADTKGEAGPAGAPSPTNSAGTEGKTGLTGPQGTEGKTAPTGPQGPAAEEEREGPEGKQGPEGPEGPEGPKGPEAPEGLQGSQGSEGSLPVGQWDLNEDAGTVAHNDFLRSSGNGALEGGVSWTAGRFQSGLSFDGVDGEVDVPNSLALEGTNITVSAWVKADGSPGDYKYIIGKGASGCCTGSYGLYTGANGGLEFYVATSPTSYVVSPDPGPAIWDGEWHNVIGTFDGSSVRIYVDGQQVGSGSPDSSPIQYNLPTGSDLVIGDYPWCPGLDFKGDIDEVKVFDQALSPAEISLGYHLSNGLPYFSPFDPIL